MRVFGSERLLNTEHIAQTRQTCFEVQLTTLRQVRFLAVVVELEQAGATFHRRLNDTRRRNFHDSVFGIDGSESGQDGSSDLHDGRRGFRSKVKMSKVLTHRQVGFLKQRRW
jgi:hypothetical protein